MAESKVSEIEKKKQELEKELARLQQGLDKSFDEVKEDVSTTLDPKAIIRRHPLKALGASVALGFLFGSSSSKGRSGSGDHSTGMGHVIGYELKKALMKRGVGILLDFLDDKVDEIKKHSQE